MTIEVFSLEEFVSQTAWPLPSGKRFKWTFQYAEAGQVIFGWTIPVKGLPEGVSIDILVYSSIDPFTGFTREEAGQDSIRIVVRVDTGDPKPIAYKWPGVFWITRQPGWSQRLFDHIKQHVDMIKANMRRCECGSVILPFPTTKGKNKGRFYLKCVSSACQRPWKGWASQ